MHMKASFVIFSLVLSSLALGDTNLVQGHRDSIPFTHSRFMTDQEKQWLTKLYQCASNPKLLVVGDVRCLERTLNAILSPSMTLHEFEFFTHFIDRFALNENTPPSFADGLAAAGLYTLLSHRMTSLGRREFERIRLHWNLIYLGRKHFADRPKLRQMAFELLKTSDLVAIRMDIERINPEPLKELDCNGKLDITI